MVSKLGQKACVARLLVILLILIITITRTTAQKLSKYFTSSMQESGILYFIEPEEDFRNKENRATLSYDLTYLTVNDSVTFNFTYFDREIRAIDSLSIFVRNERIISGADKVFIESGKNGWKHRYSAKFLFDDLERFFEQNEEAPVVVSFNSSDQSLRMKYKEWIKQSKIVSKIILLIKANRD